MIFGDNALKFQDGTRMGCTGPLWIDALPQRFDLAIGYKFAAARLLKSLTNGGTRFVTCERARRNSYPNSITGSRPIRRASERSRASTRSPPSGAHSPLSRKASRWRSTASVVLGSTPGIAAEMT